MKRTLSRIIALLLCVLMLFSVSACSCKKENVNENPTPSVSEPPAFSVPEAVGALHADITNDSHFDRFDIIYTFGNDEYENYMLWCEAEMTDFYIVGLHPDAESWTTDGVKLFEKDKITPKEAVNYIRMVPEGFPAEAVVYTANGETYMYAIGYNGRDGGISLMPIEKLIVDPDAFKSESTTTTTTTTAKATTTTTEADPSVMVEIYWVSDDLDIFVQEVTIQSDSKWHVWLALKTLNKQIPTKCSLKSGNLVSGKNGVMELDFSEHFMEVGNSTNGRPVLQAIANTYIMTYDLQAVRFMVEGEYLETAICGYAEEFAYTEC